MDAKVWRSFVYFDKSASSVIETAATFATSRVIQTLSSVQSRMRTSSEGKQIIKHQWSIRMMMTVVMVKVITDTDDDDDSKLVFDWVSCQVILLVT